MELGATVCTPTSPDCNACPLSTVCIAKRLSDYCKASVDASNTLMCSKNLDNSQDGMKKKSRKSTKSTKMKIEVQEYDGDSITSNTSMSTNTSAATTTPLPRFHVSITDFPYKKAKKPPVDKILSVAVLIRRSVSTGGNAFNSSLLQYLFCKRPKTGLLANQWEFPNVCIGHMCHKQADSQETKTDPDSSSRKRKKNDGLKRAEKKKDMVVDLNVANDIAGSSVGKDMGVCMDRWSSVAMYLQSLGISLSEPSSNKDMKLMGAADIEVSSDGSGGLSVLYAHDLSDAILHVFSHERHTMYVHIRVVNGVASGNECVGDNVVTLQDNGASSASAESNQPGGAALASPDDATASEASSACKWMSLKDLTEQHGITTGCKRIVTQVEQHLEQHLSAVADTTNKWGHWDCPS